jgi:hypothetical protein
LLIFIRLATCSRNRIEIGPCAFGACINDGKWGCDMALQRGQSLIGMQMNLPLLGRVKDPAKERFALQALEEV